VKAKGVGMTPFLLLQFLLDTTGGIQKCKNQSAQEVMRIDFKKINGKIFGEFKKNYYICNAFVF